MTLLEVSAKLAAISPKMVVGSKVLDCLQLERPILKKYSFDNLLNYQKATIELQLDDIQDVSFIGQIVQNQSLPQEIIFLVKPFAKNLSKLSDAGVHSIRLCAFRCIARSFTWYSIRRHEKPPAEETE